MGQSKRGLDLKLFFVLFLWHFHFDLPELVLILQEPGTEAQIKEFAKGYNAEFDLFSKIEVNGDNAHPLWQWMKVQPKGKGFMGK